MYIFSCYAILALITIYTIIAMLIVIRNSKSVMLAAPLALVYYFSLYGAWDIISTKLRGEAIHYESFMFSLHIDEFYLWSLILYSLFLFLYSMSVIGISKYKLRVDTNDLKRYYIERINKLNDSRYYNGIAWVLFMAFAYFARKDIVAAIVFGENAYEMSRFSSEFGSNSFLIQFCRDTFIFMSVTTLFADVNLIKKKLLIPLVICFLMNLLLGNRGTLLCAFVYGVVMFVELYGIQKVFTIKNIILSVFSFAAISSIGILRGLSVEDILTGNFAIDYNSLFESASKSNERFAAHMSLYGVLKNDVSFTFGSSIYSFITSLIPSFFGLPRGESVYIHYCRETMGGVPDVGVTIHHVTGWYLNFGILGVLFGAWLLGFVTRYLYVRKANFIYLFGCAIFVATTIPLMRGGCVEPYKGVLINDVIIPMLIVRFCLKRN